MHDLAGFALLLAALVLGLYLLIMFVFPFVVTYLLGMTVFFVLAVIALRRGRRHPSHLECLLKPGVPTFLALSSLLVPAAHATLSLLTDARDLWPWILAANTLPCVTWTARMLLWHREQQARYAAEGHDLEDLLEALQSREAALEVRADALEWAGAPQPAPEDWERFAGDVDAGPDRTADARSVAREVEELRLEYVRQAQAVREALEDVRTGRAKAPHPVVAQVNGVLPGLEARDAATGTRAAVLLSDARGGLQGWDAAPA